MYIMKSEQLDFVRLGKILSSYQSNELPQLKQYYNYWHGKQAISYKMPTDAGKVVNKVVVNYCKDMVDSYQGYIAANAITYQCEDDFTEINKVLEYNDQHSEDNTLLENALVYGKAVELCYIDADGKQRFKALDPKECIPIYDDTLEENLLFGVRFYVNDYVEDNTQSYIVEVYDKTNIYKYKSNSGFSTFELLEQVPHHYKQVPMIFFDLNREQDPIFSQIMSLNDAYNSLLSGEVDSWDQFSDAYLVLKGMTADEEDLTAMKEHRVLMLDTDASAEYLTKNINDTQIENMLQNIDKKIHQLGHYPDFNSESFGASSGIALEWRMLGMQNVAGNIESQFKKALQKRIELICEYLYLVGGEEVWRTVDIIFHHNLPNDVTAEVNLINALRGLVSDKTLLGQISFVPDPETELELVKAQRAEQMSLYSFGDVE